MMVNNREIMTYEEECEVTGQGRKLKTRLGRSQMRELNKMGGGEYPPHPFVEFRGVKFGLFAILSWYH